MPQPKLIYWLSQADRKVQAIVKQHLPCELHSPSQMLVLFHLDQHDGMTLTELALRMQLVPSAITGLIQRMTAQQLVIKKISQEDGRTSYLYLSELSRTMLPQLKQKAALLNQSMQQDFNAEEIRTIEKWLRFLAEDLNKTMENSP